MVAWIMLPVKVLVTICVWSSATTNNIVFARSKPCGQK